MSTASFDKNIVIQEPEAVENLVDALMNGKSRRINTRLAAPQELARGEELLKQFLSRCKD
jgi:hypothetical protein